MKKKQFFFPVFLAIVFLFASEGVYAATYEVGPAQPLQNIAQVPWATLQPGDTVLIHWRATPYKEKWVICRQGTQTAPITVRGVSNASGDLPVIDGNGAVTPTNLNFTSEQRGVIKIGGANVPADTMPKYIVIENLEIRSAHPNYSFTDDGGNAQIYSSAASSIYVEKGENITVRNCKIHDSANGFFVASSDETVSRNILVEGNYIFGNGIVGSAFQHNNYTAAIGIVFQYNRFGAMRAGANGNALKDRSAGTVVRYNWIEHGNRQLDLVEGEDSIQIRNAPEYRKTFVYGNVLIEPDGAGNSQITHYGGDNGDAATYRKGTLYFYNNTIVSTRTGNTTLFRLSTNEETCDARNNIFYVTASGANLALLDDTGVLSISHNWLKPNWRVSHGTPTGTVNNDGTSVLAASPAFANEAAQDFRLASTSAAINAGTSLNADVLPLNNVVRQYLKHQTSEVRIANGQIDIGAYEFGSAPLQITIDALPNGLRGRFYNQPLQASGGSGNYVWTVSSGSLPLGMWLDSTNGRIRGKAAVKGVWNFTLTAQDSQNPSVTASKNFTITVKLFAGI
jgi:parallel beta-helix repeat protein